MMGSRVDFSHARAARSWRFECPGPQGSLPPPRRPSRREAGGPPDAQAGLPALSPGPRAPGRLVVPPRLRILARASSVLMQSYPSRHI